jgi:hypothetical protein
MTFDHDFGYSFPIFSSLLNKEERRILAKIVIKGHASLLDLKDLFRISVRFYFAQLFYRLAINYFVNFFFIICEKLE